MQLLHHGSDLYSIVNGTIIDKGWDAEGYGNYIIMKDDETKQGFLYGHMRDPSPLNVGGRVEYGTYVGHEGATGNVTGIHLHLMQEDLTNKDWEWGLPISAYENPADYLGIPNVLNTSAIYHGTPKPPTPRN